MSCLLKLRDYLQCDLLMCSELVCTINIHIYIYIVVII